MAKEKAKDEIKTEEVKEGEKKQRKPREVRTITQRISELDEKITKYEELLEKAKKKKEELEFKRDNPSVKQSSPKFDMETLMFIQKKGLDADDIKNLIKREYGL